MRNFLISLFVAIFLATSAWALVETADNGPIHITTCYVNGVGPIASGNVVVLQTTSPTYPGKEVTGSTTIGDPIYGVVVQSDPLTAVQTDGGAWVRVQTFGYCSNIKKSTEGTITVAHGLTTSATKWAVADGGAAAAVTGNAISLDTVGPTGTQITGYLEW